MPLSSSSSSFASAPWLDDAWNHSNSSSHPFVGCREIFVGGGWGGVYSFYRRVLDGIARNQSASQYCLMEQASRIGGRTYSVPLRRQSTDFVVDVGAYRFAADMYLVHDLVVGELNLTTACYEPHCPSAQADFPDHFDFPYQEPLLRIVHASTGLPSGYGSALHRMIDTCVALGARVFVNTQLIHLEVTESDPDDDKEKKKEDETTSSVSSPSIRRMAFRHAISGQVVWLDHPEQVQVLVLNVARNHLFQVAGLRHSLHPHVQQTLRCIVFDVPDDLFGPDMAERMRQAQFQDTNLAKAYVYYDDAWWHSLLPNATSGDYPPGAAFEAVNTTQGLLFNVHWSDGPVHCSNSTTSTSTTTRTTTTGNHSRSQSCHGFLEIYYSVSNETWYSSLPKLRHGVHVQDSTLGMMWDDDDNDNQTSNENIRAVLQQTHDALWEALDPLWRQQSADIYNASRHVAPPRGILVGAWHRPNLQSRPLGGRDLYTAPSKVYYEPTLSGTPEQACGGVPGLTDASYRTVVLQPFDTPAALAALQQQQPQEAIQKHDGPDSSRSWMRHVADPTRRTKSSSSLSSSLSSSSQPTSRIFLVNNDYVCANVRTLWGDWAEESLMQAERAMHVLGMEAPEWLTNASYYQRHVLDPLQQQQQAQPPTTGGGRAFSARTNLTNDQPHQHMTTPTTTTFGSMTTTVPLGSWHQQKDMLQLSFLWIVVLVVGMTVRLGSRSCRRGRHQPTKQALK